GSVDEFRDRFWAFPHDTQTSDARQPRRCQCSTVSGLTITMASNTAGNRWYNQTKISRSILRKRSRFRDLRLTPGAVGAGLRSRPRAQRHPQTLNAARAKPESPTRTSRVAVTHLPCFVTRTRF